jgi:hypothetical protein
MSNYKIECDWHCFSLSLPVNFNNLSSLVSHEHDKHHKMLALDSPTSIGHSCIVIMYHHLSSKRSCITGYGIRNYNGIRCHHHHLKKPKTHVSKFTVTSEEDNKWIKKYIRTSFNQFATHVSRLNHWNLKYYRPTIVLQVNDCQR